MHADDHRSEAAPNAVAHHTSPNRHATPGEPQKPHTPNQQTSPTHTRRAHRPLAPSCVLGRRPNTHDTVCVTTAAVTPRHTTAATRHVTPPTAPSWHTPPRPASTSLHSCHSPRHRHASATHGATDSDCPHTSASSESHYTAMTWHGDARNLNQAPTKPQHEPLSTTLPTAADLDTAPRTHHLLHPPRATLAARLSSSESLLRPHYSRHSHVCLIRCSRVHHAPTADTPCSPAPQHSPPCQSVGLLPSRRHTECTPHCPTPASLPPPPHRRAHSTRTCVTTPATATSAGMYGPTQSMCSVTAHALCGSSHFRRKTSPPLTTATGVTVAHRVSCAIVRVLSESVKHVHGCPPKPGSKRTGSL